MKTKKPLTAEERRKKLNEVTSGNGGRWQVSERERSLNNITWPKPKDPLEVKLEGKTGRPLARTFGYKEPNTLTYLSELFGLSKKSDRYSYSNLKNRWEDIEYGTDKKKKAKKK